MKKKILSICLVCCLAAVAVIGGTLAYFTDTDQATNTFTTTGVKIDLIEQQRDYDDDGTLKDTLIDFENGKVLYPIVGDAHKDRDKFGMTTAGNYLDKIVTVKNLEADAYVRVYYALPSALDDPDNASNNILHCNMGKWFVASGDKTDKDAENADFNANMGKETFVEKTTIDGIDYNVYYRTYKKSLTKDEVTGSAFMVGVYLDKDVDTKDVTEEGTTKTVYTITKNGTTTNIDFDFSNGIKVPVFAVGAQAAGFTDADTAIDTAFGASYNPWTQANA